jgi:hypothetical protein
MQLAHANMSEDETVSNVNKCINNSNYIPTVYNTFACQMITQTSNHHHHHVWLILVSNFNSAQLNTHALWWPFEDQTCCCLKKKYNVSGCCHSAVEMFTPLGCCMALIYSFLLMFCDNPMFKGQYGTDTLSWNVRNHQTMLRMTGEWRPQVILHVTQDVELI